MTRSDTLHAAAHAVAVPPAILALAALVASAFSAGGMMALGVATEATWLWPSMRWMLLHQPLTVATWLAWLVVPTALTVGAIALLHRRVGRVAWWRWALGGGLTHAAALGGAAALGWLPLLTVAAAPYVAAGGFVIGALATGWVESLVRLALWIAGYRRKGLAQRTGAAPARGTNVSARGS